MGLLIYVQMWLISVGCVDIWVVGKVLSNQCLDSSLCFCFWFAGFKMLHFFAVNFTGHVYFNERIKHFGLMEIKHLFVLCQIARDIIECIYL